MAFAVKAMITGATFLRELLEKENYTDYGIEVHGLKSASANIGAMELSAQAREHALYLLLLKPIQQFSQQLLHGIILIHFQ